MHQSAFENCQHFFSCYGKEIASQSQSVRVIEIGAKIVDGSIVNGSIRSCSPKEFEYIGLDFEQGNGVDLLLSDPYVLPFDNDSIDVVLTSSVFEHSEMFWLVYLEILRVLKPTGLYYMNAPSNGYFHRFPVDCWRFYPDSGNALVTWARRNNINAALLESYTSSQKGAVWNDFVAVFLKDSKHINLYPNRILTSNLVDFQNGKINGNNDFVKYNRMPEDLMKLKVIEKVIKNEIKISS
jgi:SAM-dependent methyltransferase